MAALPTLPTTAAPAWQAYQAMCASKRRHFAYLQYLEDKYQHYGQPDAAEHAERQRLLDAHATCVAAFRQALATLKQTDPAAFAQLIQHLARQS